MPTSILGELLADDRRWSEIASVALPGGARLLSASRHIGNSRVYGNDVFLAKIRRHCRNTPNGILSLHDEAQVLKRLGRTARFHKGLDFDALILPRIEGQTLDTIIPALSIRQRLALLRRTFYALRAVNQLGVSHGDLRPDNVLVSDSQNVTLIDFDRAVATTPLRSAMRDLWGIAPRDAVFYPFWKLVLLALAPRSRTIALRLRTLFRRSSASAPSHGDHSLDCLEGAWSIARRSVANAPGQSLAYYAFTFRGVHFPGERPWPLRWEMMRSSIDFRNKRFLELGCNVGLLSNFALAYGADSAHAVDHDDTILEAARLVASAFNSTVTFSMVDLAGSTNWEDDLPKSDIVAAMSLLHWLSGPAQQRLLRFLGTHREVIFEGHDPLEVEKQRLRRAGFTTITVLGRTERNRDVLLASRAA